jgi:hypothetical protein
MAKRILTALLALTGAISIFSAEKLLLAKDGKSDYQIVIPSESKNKNVEGFVKVAAKLLQDCVMDSTEAKLPIVKEDKRDKNKPGIFLGNTRFANNQGIFPNKLKGWTYQEKAVGKNIILAGNDRSDVPGEKSKHYSKYIIGTLKAVTSFLKKNAGVKFLFPGPNGIEAPKHASMFADAGLNIKRTPLLKVNRGRNSELIYDIANNYFPANSIKLYGGHSYYTAVPKAQYAKSHPEYFALLGGKRNPASNHLCISNPEVQDLIYKEALKQLDKGYEYVELAQTDGYKPCECENCKKLFNVSSPGEKLWILHKKLAERLEKDRPGKKLVIISYGPTKKPPETFKKFPENVLIELSDYSQEAFSDWQKCEVPGGFMVYVYNWGAYPQVGLTPKTTPQSVGVQTKRFIDNKVKAIYRCGWGELFGLEGPVYYVYGRSFDEGQPGYESLSNEFYKAAYGKAYVPMKAFFDCMYKRLELYANFLAGRCPAEKFAPSNPKPLLAYNFSPEVLEAMEKNLQRAEKMAKAPKVKKRIALARKEFDYVKNLASIIHCYNAYKIALDKASFEKLAELVEERNSMIDSYYDSNGKMLKLPGWNDVKFLGGFDKDIVKVNGKLRAPVGSPFTWDTANLKKLGILPGTLKKKIKIFEASGNIPLDGNLEEEFWKNIPFETLGGVQMGKTRQISKFKMTYDNKNLYIAFNCSLPENSLKVHPVGEDGPAWQQESLEIFLAPDSPDKFFHFIFNPVKNSKYEAENSLQIDPLNPLFGKDDKTWNGDWEYKNYFYAKKGQWNAIVIIPFKSLEVKTPQEGAVWYINLAREHFFLESNDKHPRLELSLWSPNLETRSFHDRNAFGELIFSGKAKR